MYFLGHGFLTATAFTMNDHGIIGRRYQVDLLKDSWRNTGVSPKIYSPETVITGPFSLGAGQVFPDSLGGRMQAKEAWVEGLMVFRPG
jgi:hypothetical protein